MAECRWPSKKQYASRKDALSAIYTLKDKANIGNDWSAYPCPGSTHWHIGHDRGKQQKRIRRVVRSANYRFKQEAKRGKRRRKR